MFMAVYNRGANNNKNSSKVKLKLWIIGMIIGIWAWFYLIDLLDDPVLTKVQKIEAAQLVGNISRPTTPYAISISEKVTLYFVNCKLITIKLLGILHISK